MNASAIIFMLLGMIFLWGGLAAAIIHNQRAEKRLGKEENYHA